MGRDSPDTSRPRPGIPGPLPGCVGEPALLPESAANAPMTDPLQPMPEAMHQGAPDADFAPRAPGGAAGASGGGGGGAEFGAGVGVGGRPGHTPEIPRAISELLRGFAMALHRFAMYPTGHPSLLPVAERMLLQLTDVLARRPALTLGVASRQMLVDGGSTPEDHPVMSDLAARLHGHQLGAVIFRRGVDLEELVSLLDVLSRDPVRGERPLGLLPLRDRPSWVHLQLLPVEYRALELGKHPGEGTLPVRELWIALFHSVFRREALAEFGFDPAAFEAGGDLPSGARLAELVQAWARRSSDSATAPDEVAGDAPPPDAGPAAGEEGSAGALMDGLCELVSGLQWTSHADGADLRMRTSEFVEAMEPAVLSRLIRLGTDAEMRRSLLLNASRAGLTSGAVLRFVDAAHAAEGRRLSAQLTRLLLKMARRGESSRPGLGRTEARSALREQLDRLVAPPGALSGGGDEVGLHDDDGLGIDLVEQETLTAPTPLRLLELAIRLDEPGPVLEAALRASVRAGNVGAVLDLAEGAPSDSRTAGRVEDWIFSPERLTLLLSGADVDEASMRRIVDALGDDAIEPLFERLVGSESRAVRRKIFDRLAAMGPRITPIILHYLASDLWFVQRNMLALLQRMPVLPAGFSPVQYMVSHDVRVRREALPLAFRDPGNREPALAVALRDSDERVVRGGLLELQEGVPEAVIPALVANVLEGGGHPHLRSLAARALGRSQSPAARDALIRVCTGDRGLLARRPRLAPATPEVIAAVHALAEGWTGDPDARWVLEAGLHSEDPRVRAAAWGSPAAGRSIDEPAIHGENAS
ncbi:MAG: HEAT repeat domain-containing protein [Gemmatimonadales bacterium]|nr:MAG: HEAT repeat domain-containing protein [Gemmatimonadales bacterium]